MPARVVEFFSLCVCVWSLLAYGKHVECIRRVACARGVLMKSDLCHANKCSGS